MDKINILSICDRNTANVINKFYFVDNHFFIENPREKNENNIKLTEDENFKIMNYRKFKFGTFENDVNWDVIPPLDEYILEKMAPYEAYCLKMYERVARIEKEFYESRKYQYLIHLRFWNYFLDKNKIDVFFEYAPPHIGFDYVLYGLCKLKGIKTLNLIRMYQLGYLIDDIKTIFNDYDLLNMETHATAKLKKFKDMYNSHKEKGLPENKKDKPLVIPNDKAHYRIIEKNKKIINFYNSISIRPDLNKKYIYVPLHYQYEGTTCPMGGYFASQYLMLEVLNRLDIKIYVKEHPRMSRNRTISLYRKIEKLKNVQLINTDFSTYDLIDNAYTTATVTGMATFESILRGKTAMIFGNSFLQYAPGIFQVKSLKDAENAVEKIDKFKHSAHDLKQFLFNFENNFVFSFIDFDESYIDLSAELKSRIIGHLERKKRQLELKE